MVNIAVVDYDMGNLHSACKALEKAGATPVVTDQSAQILAAEAVLLPGVGAFDPAMEHLRDRHLEAAIHEAIASGKPFLGICLGMQILFESSAEGREKGLGAIAGSVERFQPEPDITIPHMGWNQLQFTQPDHPIWQGLPSDPYVYFVHSFYVAPTDPHVTAAMVTHGQQKVTAAIAQNNLVAMQFHPEKSATIGLKILENFVHWVKNQ
ncbi:imidazole glycerol phosphate synthase subunit HisH [Synechococcus moorigangaii CMS01]|nr:imidazole glycerol phosphate synthase subunit HisH [Synechococcus moorigangaii CMS01]